MSKIVHFRPHPSPTTLVGDERTYNTSEEPALPDGFLRMTPEELVVWIESQIAAGWRPPAPTDAPTGPREISRDELFRRVRDAGKLPELTAIVEALSASDRLELFMRDRLNVDDSRVRAAITQPGLDPEVILAP